MSRISHTSSSSHAYNAQNGQVFTETLVKHRKRTKVAWYRTSIKRRFRAHRRTGKDVQTETSPGPRSLVAIASQVVAENLGLAETEDLARFPVRIIWRIWEILCERPFCLQAWKIMAKYLLREGHPGNSDWPTMSLYRYQATIDNPRESFMEYLTPLTSSSFEFIVHLKLSKGAAFSVNEMLSLPELKNLGVLEIMTPEEDDGLFPRINDRMLRAWSETPGAFPILRVLRIWGDVTSKSLQYVAKFPTISLYDVGSNNRNDWAAFTLPRGFTALTKAASSEKGRCSWFQTMTMLNVEFQQGNTSAPDAKQGALEDVEGWRSAIESPNTSLSYLPTTQGWAGLGAQHKCSRGYDDFAFPSWAFTTYSYIGSLCGERDLKGQGVSVPWKSVRMSGRFPATLLPFASLCLGIETSGNQSEKGFVDYEQPSGTYAAVRRTFIRPHVQDYRSPSSEQGPSKPERGQNAVLNTSSKPLAISARKKRKLNDIFSQIGP